MPPLFKKSDKKLSTKSDKVGRIAIRIFLIDENKGTNVGIMPATNNLREDIILEDTTVSVVTTAIQRALLGE